MYINSMLAAVTLDELDAAYNACVQIVKDQWTEGSKGYEFERNLCATYYAQELRRILKSIRRSCKL